MKRFFVAGAIMLLAVLAGCAKSPEAPREDAVLTVRIRNESAVEPSQLAVSYYADGTALGSMVCQPLGDLQAGDDRYDFVFTREQLPEEPIEVFRVEVYAARAPGEDFAPCGSAEIRRPGRGETYTLTLTGETVEGLALSPEETEGKKEEGA